MAETNSLLNCRTGYCTGGSNPPLSAKQKSLSNTTGSFTLLILFDAVYSVDCETGVIRLKKVKAVVNPGIENKGANLQVIGCSYEKGCIPFSGCASSFRFHRPVRKSAVCSFPIPDRGQLWIFHKRRLQ